MTNQNTPQPGDTLANGATVVISLPHPTDPRVCYVGAKVEGHHPYATWACNLADHPHDWSTYWGHYFKTKREMLAGLIERAQGEG
jgi:hypothetical protein